MNLSMKDFCKPLGLAYSKSTLHHIFIKTLITYLLVFNLADCKAQDSDDRQTFNQYYAQAIDAIAQKKFLDAEDIFKKIGRLDLVFPDELAYFYGYTQFNLGKYMQAKEAFEKYISLRTDTGRYAHYAHLYIHTADCNLKGYFYEQSMCEECKGAGKTEIGCRVCKSQGKEVCNLCFGRGALKKNDNFGEKYESCKKCEGSGYYRCNRCNGTGKELDKCLICEGNGKVLIKKDCHLLPQAR